MCKDAGSHFESLNSVGDLHAKSLHMAWDGSKAFRSTHRLDQLLLCKSDSWKAGSGPLQSQELLRLSKKARGDRWFPRGSPLLALRSVLTLTTGQTHTARLPWVSDPVNGENHQHP